MEAATETACYLGASLSALIAYRIYGMPDKTFINKMFLLYFAVDAILGTLNTFLLFRLQRFGRIFKIINIPIWQLNDYLNLIEMMVRNFNRQNVHCSYQYGDYGNQADN